VRKIIHVDMDAFYASVEQRDDPQLRGKPVVVAWRGNRSVVCAASYEARSFGIHSAMPAVRAERLCPAAIFIAPDFTRYRAVSRSVCEIFKRHTNLIEVGVGLGNFRDREDDGAQADLFHLQH
jgi:DNA polymerase-4